MGLPLNLAKSLIPYQAINHFSTAENAQMGRPGQTQIKRNGGGFSFHQLSKSALWKSFYFIFLFPYMTFWAMGFIGRMFEWSNKEWRMCKKFFFSFYCFWRWPRHWGCVIFLLLFFLLLLFISHSRHPLLLLHLRPPQQRCLMSITGERNMFEV